MRHKINYKFITSFLLFALMGVSASAQDPKQNTGSSDDWLFWTAGAVLVAIFFFLSVVLFSVNAAFRKEAGQPFTVKGWWAALDRRLFTKAVPVEKEEDVLLDHDYDGIRELDNALPPWWKYGFYFTIAVAVLYMLRFHVWKTGPDPIQEYDQEMKTAAAQLEEYRKKSGNSVDEKTVTMADAAGIAEGDKLYHANCFACHGAKGEGGVGPNLTDNYWLHGGSINDVFKTIKIGVPEKGMQAWEKTYSPEQIRNLASYVRTLVGTNPPNGKSAQGELYEETKTDSKAKDSTVAVK